METKKKTIRKEQKLIYHANEDREAKSSVNIFQERERYIEKGTKPLKSTRPEL